MVYFGAMIDRSIDLKSIRSALKRSRIVALLGPRQCGKTTLARQFIVVYPGAKRYSLAKQVDVVPLADFVT